MTQQVLDAVRLSDEQAKLLLKIHLSPTPKAAYAETQDGRKAVESSKLLTDLGYIEMSAGSASVTPRGDDALRDESLVDNMGELTSHAQELVDSDDTGPTTTPPPGDSDPFADDGDSSLPRMESFSLIRELNNSVES